MGEAIIAQIRLSVYDFSVYKLSVELKGLITLDATGGIVDVSSAVRRSGDLTEIDIIVSPNAKRCELGEVDPWRKRLAVKVSAPPEGGRANREVEELFTTILRSKATVSVGHTARMKVIQVNLDRDEVIKRLEAMK
ncbi:MAG: hypothetical protein A4E32_00298 [Methanomassiliicoccales archaeon PtaU1.Bin124]|nr:MAG: hypothetical protein A4E32_00298 [Methanomassiliicoccales archaeon PtaU1.Bin124]